MSKSKYKSSIGIVVAQMIIYALALALILAWGLPLALS